MELMNYLKFKVFLFLFGVTIILYSCDNKQRTSEVTETPSTEETADTFEGSEMELENRRERLTDYMQNQISRIQSELDSLRQKVQTASGEEKNQIENHIGRLEKDIEDLEQQQSDLAQADPENLERIERVIHDWVETQNLDRSVRGEGTSLDGPDFNRTGTRTGTEVDTQVPVEVDDAEGQSPSVPSGQ